MESLVVDSFVRNVTSIVMSGSDENDNIPYLQNN